MTPTVTALFVAIGALGYLTLLGYAPALLLLPARLRPWFWLAAPLMGLITAALVLGWLVLVVPGSWAGVIALVGALAAGAWCASRGLLPPRGQYWREQGVMAGVMLAGLAFALAPLAGRPDLISIGPNWDVEIYLPLAAYLQQSPLGFRLTDPAGVPFPGLPNPLLWRANFFDPRWSGLTFQEFHAVIDTLGGLAPDASFVGLLAALFALVGPAAFLLLRVTLRLGVLAALAGGALAGLAAPGLHVIYWSFGQQASALPMVPFAIVAFGLAITDGQRRSRLLAGLSVAALLASYVPALPTYVAVAIALVAAQAIVEPGWRPLLARVGGIAVVAVAAAPWAVLRCLERGRHFLEDRGIAGLTVGPDVREFPRLGWAFGVYPAPDQGFAGLLPLGITPLVETGVVRLLLLAVIAVGVVVAWRRRDYVLALLCVAPLLVLLPLRWATPYPYGYLKTIPFMAPVLIGLLAGGASALWWLAGRQPLWARGVLTAAICVFFTFNLVSTVRLVDLIRQDSPMAYRPLQGLTAAVPPGAAVFVSGHRDTWGPKGGALAYALRNANLYGYLTTGFSTFYRPDPAGAYDYALFADAEAPWREVFTDVLPVWTGAGLQLYRVPDGVQSFVDLGAATPPVVERSGGQGSAAGIRIADWTAEGYPAYKGWTPPLLGTLADTTPPQVRYPMVSRGGNFETEVPGASDSQQRVPQVVLTVASFRAQVVTARVGDTQVTLDVPAGLSSHSLGSTNPGTKVVVQDNGNQAPVWVRSIAVAATGQLPARSYPDAVLVAHTARLAENGVMMDVLYQGPPLQTVVDVYSEDGAVHYGYWVTPPTRSTSRALRVRLDTVQHRLISQRREGATPFAAWRGEEPDGEYRIYLFLWRDQQVANQVPLASFTLRDRRAVAVSSEQGDLFVG